MLYSPNLVCNEYFFLLNLKKCFAGNIINPKNVVIAQTNDKSYYLKGIKKLENVLRRSVLRSKKITYGNKTFFFEKTIFNQNVTDLLSTLMFSSFKLL